MKVFQMNDCEWWAAEDLESAKKACMEATGLPEDEACDDPHELSDEAMNRLIFHDDNETRTFKEQLDRMIVEGTEFPVFFAMTEF